MALSDRLWFLFLAVLVLSNTYYLVTLSRSDEFSLGVGFIGYFAASLLLMVAVLGKRMD